MSLSTTVRVVPKLSVSFPMIVIAHGFLSECLGGKGCWGREKGDGMLIVQETCRRV